MTTSAHINTRAKPFLFAAGVALLLGGCGSSNNDSTTGSGNRGSFQSFVAAAYRYSACMRGHGVPSFPDPHVTADGAGKQAIGIHPVPKTVAASPQFRAALEACKGIMPGPEGESPKQRSEHERARAQYLLAFAQCLRAHGVTGFPDPTAQGQLTLEMIHAAGVDLQAPSVLPAARACVGVTHGAITFAQVEQAIQHPSGSETSGGGDANSPSGGQ
jgi:hypothetical protein